MIRRVIRPFLPAIMREFPGLTPTDFDTMTRSEAIGIVSSLASQFEPGEQSEASAKAARAQLAGRLRATARYLAGSSLGHARSAS